MRIILAVVVLLTASAYAKPANDSESKPVPPVVRSAPAAQVVVPAAPAPVVKPFPGGQIPAAPGVIPVNARNGAGDRHGGSGHDGGAHPGDRHHRDHNRWEYPYSYPYPPLPETWPFPPSPYSQYYYPYPPQYYGSDDADGAGGNSTRGLVVPGDMPMGVTSFWNYCDAPDGYYPYVKTCTHEWTRIPVSPPPPGVAPPLSFSEWQWCAETKGFFPYVTSCREGFEPVPVTLPGGTTAGPPSAANWFYCEEPKGYAPYVVQCKRDWRPVPAVPPPSVKLTVRDEKPK